MKKILLSIVAAVTMMAAQAQTLNVTVGSVTYQFPASATGDMTYSDGTTLTILGKAFTLSEVTNMYVDATEVTNNAVGVTYSNSSAAVTVAGNIAQYITPVVSGAHVSITQSNTDDVDGDEITYTLSGTSSDGEFYMEGEYKATVALNGLTLTNASGTFSGSAIHIQDGKRIEVSVKQGTTNTLKDYANGSQKACLYVKGHMELKGKGTLNVYGNYAHAIRSGEYTTMKNCTVNVLSAVKDGLNCSQYLYIESGTLEISGVGDDGIQCDIDDAENATSETSDHEDEDSGNIYIVADESGNTPTITITGTATAAKCIKSEGTVNVSAGTITLNAKGDLDVSDTSDISHTAGINADGNFVQTGGTIKATVTGAAGRGITADGTLTVSGGSLTVTNTGATKSSGSTYFCSAKSLKAASVVISGGTITVTTSGAASKGIKADDGSMTITGGTINVTTTGAGATDGTESDGKGCAGLDADVNATISGGDITLKSTGTGGKCIKVDGVLTVSGSANISATSTGSNYSSGSYSASAKAIKAGTKTQTSSTKAYAPGGGGFGGGGNQGGGGFPGGGGGQGGGTYTYSGGIVITGGTIIASASNHEGIESKGTIEISGGNVYSYSSDDAINSASTFTITGGYVMANSSGNDGMDANGNFYIKGGNVFAVATSQPEVGIDANTEGGYKLYITGGNVVAIGGLESGSSLSGVTSKSTSYSKGSWYTLKSGSTTAFSFKVPSNSKMGSSMTICTSGTPSVSSGSISGTTIWNGYGIY